MFEMLKNNVIPPWVEPRWNDVAFLGFYFVFFFIRKFLI